MMHTIFPCWQAGYSATVPLKRGGLPPRCSSSIESHHENGSVCQNGGVESLCSEYTTDGGHLSDSASQRVAKAFWVLISKLAEGNQSTPSLLSDSTTPVISITTTGKNTKSEIIQQRDVTITRWLTRGSRGTDVQLLQTYLKQLNYFPQTQDTSTFFGIITEQSLRKYQCAKIQVCSGTPTTTGYGATGPRTRRELGEIE